MEALPQLFVQLTILSLSFDKNSGAYGIINPYAPIFLATFSISVLSLTLGVAKFLKNGPCQLVPRDFYGCGFFSAMLITFICLLTKGAFYIFLVGTNCKIAIKNISLFNFFIFMNFKYLRNISGHNITVFDLSVLY